MLCIFRIEGHSLYPYFKEGDRVLALRARRFIPLKAGRFVIFDLPPYGLMIKRIKHIGAKNLFVEGTSADSIDSTVFGSISKERVRYVVLFKIP